MRSSILLLIPILFISCQNKKTPQKEAIDIIKELVQNRVIKPEFQSILDSAYVKGTIVIHELKNDSLYCNDFSLGRKNVLPASTFKIPNSIIALETRIVKDDSTILKWDGNKRRFKMWEHDLSFKDAFHRSCLPCYQEIVRQMGVDSMQKYLDKLQYSDIKVDSSNLDVFWIEGETGISALSQTSFLQRFYEKNLSISKRTYYIMKEMMVIEKNDSYILSGKTGWGIKDDINIGWFIGHLKTKDKEYVFATRIEPRRGFDMTRFARARKEVTFNAFKILGVKIQ